MGSSGGGSSGPRKPTEAETQLTLRQVELAEFQLEELRLQREFQTAERERLEPLVSQFEELLPLQATFQREELERARRLAPVSEELFQLELERIRRGGGATPEEQALIDEAARRAIEQGESDIARFQSETTERIAQELAPGLGLRPTDTPIQDRAARVASEATRQQGQLVSGVRQAQATAGLNFPLASQQLQAARTQFQQQLSQATSQFQDQLRQASVLNRLRLSGQPQQLGLGLATGFAFPSPAPRGNVSRTSGSSSIGPILSGVGAIFSGLRSSRVVKRDPERRDTGMRDITHEATLEKVVKLPVERWRYKEGLGLDNQDHVGVYAEDFTEAFDLGDSKTINLLDVSGIGLSATKGLAMKVKKLEKRMDETLDLTVERPLSAKSNVDIVGTIFP